MIEVISESSATFDYGEKRRLYMKVPSIKAVVLVEQRRAYVEAFVRTDLGWMVTHAEGDETLSIIDPELSLPLAELYGGLLGKPQTSEPGD